MERISYVLDNLLIPHAVTREQIKIVSAGAGVDDFVATFRLIARQINCNMSIAVPVVAVIHEMDDAHSFKLRRTGLKMIIDLRIFRATCQTPLDHEH